MLHRTLRPLLCSMLSLCLLACASGSSAPTLINIPITLNGNWSLAGARTPAAYPILATSLKVQGNQITGQGTVQIQCSPSTQINGIFSLSGQIAADGTFSATYSTPASPNSGYTVAVTGASPTANSPDTWNGTYTLTASLTSAGSIPVTPCAYSHSATFTATPIATLTGIYSGPASNGVFSPGLGTNAALTLQVAQQPATLVTYGTTTTSQLPLIATLNVTGSSCFSSGSTASAPVSSHIDGDAVTLSFLMNDGSQMEISGNLTDLTAASLAITSHVIGGSCANTISSTTLTRH